ncbi:hypothetical protein [Microbulbifer epialgicus]|uniref:Immunity protein 50 n=1 Tax=Microbulbifer epialgicus TaxID=393907 RepID=A0ABV4NTF6_9GAMM
MNSVIRKEVELEVPKSQIVKEIHFSFAHLHPDDSDILKEICLFNSGPSLVQVVPITVSPWPGGWKVELSADAKCIFLQGGFFTKHFIRLCDVAFNYDCSRILFLKSVAPIPHLQIFEHEY